MHAPRNSTQRRAMAARARMSLSGKVAVVTGASAGVGRAVALLLAAQGAKVGLIARDEDALQALRAEIEAAGGEALCLALDVADAEAVLAAAQQCEDRLGPIGIWINNAMATVVGRVVDTAPEEFRRVTEVTYLGYVHGTIAALRHMAPRNCGVIVQVGSGLAYRGIPLQAAYCGAKHAIRGFTDALRTELLHDGSAVALTAVHLPAVNTPQFDWSRTRRQQAPRPVAPVYRPDAAARAIVHAARRPHREYWLGVNTPLMILGNMLAPAWLDRYLAQRAFAGQDADWRVTSQRQDNLFEPVPGLHRTNGSFAGEARANAVAFPAEYTRVGALVLVCGASAAAALALRRWLVR